MEASIAIVDILRRCEISLAGNPIRMSDDAQKYIAHILVNRDTQGRQNPPQRRLIEAKDIAESLGIALEFVIVSPKIEHAEQNLRAGMLATHSDFLRNVFLTPDGPRTEVWIESKGNLSTEARAQVECTVVEFARANRIQNLLIRFMDEAAIPTMFEVLAVIRRIAPASCEALKSELEKKSFSVPSLDWVNRRFDALRKAGLVVRISDRRYALTLEGLHRLGTQKGRLSPDVTRLLALARMGG